MEIINFDPKYYDELLAFSQKIWPEKPKAYLDYRLFTIPERSEDVKQNLLVLNDEGRIIGCTLYIPTKARINGEEESILWSHDVFVEEKYRGAAGLLLIIEQLKNKYSFGYGATDINFRIQKELGSQFISVAKHYLIVNPWFVLWPLFRLSLLKSNGKGSLVMPDRISTGGESFKRVNSPEEINIPAGGYWYDTDIEFVRDKHFLKNRFFGNFIRYYFYKLESDDPSQPDECYFVVRPTVEIGTRVLSLVDFRLSPSRPEQYKLIVKAVSKLAMMNRFPFVSLRTTLGVRFSRLFPMVLKTPSHQHIATTFSVKGSPSVFVTNADADPDFLNANLDF